MIFRDQLDAIRQAVEGARSTSGSSCAAEVKRALQALDELEGRLQELEKGLDEKGKRKAVPGHRELHEGHTILIAEDDPAARRVMIHLLDQAGYRTLEAASGASALQAALYHDGDIHVLLADLVMPDFDGAALAEQIRGVRPGIKTLFISGFDANELRRQEVKFDAKAVNFIRKPFRREELLAALRQLAG
jgi:CheY-like chemotaxis protein